MAAYHEAETICVKCGQSSPTNQISEPGCGHFTCKDCWSTHIEESIGYQKDSPLWFVTCTKCVCPLTEKFLAKHITITDLVAGHLSRNTSGLVPVFTQSIPQTGEWSSVSASATDFWHYRCDGEDDNNWGCAYRCLQMLLSNLTMSKLINVTEMPSIFKLQIDLAAYGRIAKTDIGSQKWIEPPDAAAYLREKHHLQTEEHLFVLGKETNLTIFERCWAHFQSRKTPIMIDDTIQAYTLVSAATMQTADGSEHHFMLRFDPHENKRHEFSEFEDKLKTSGVVHGLPVSDINGCRWFELDQVFANRNNTGKWLMCFPIPELALK